MQRCCSKERGYDEFKPEDIVRFSKQEVFDTIFVPENMTYLGDDVYQIKDIYNERDKDNIFNPFRKSKIHLVGK